jgi:GrpB-like predicted nucleotidyltransferase (UPF0157 family)
MTTIILTPYDARRPVQFAAIGAALRTALAPILGGTLRRIDHIGSTAIPGLAAKPVIDVQVSVQDFVPEYADVSVPPTAVEALGLSWLGEWLGAGGRGHWTDGSGCLLAGHRTHRAHWAPTTSTCICAARAASASNRHYCSATTCGWMQQRGRGTRRSSGSWPGASG